MKMAPMEMADHPAAPASAGARRPMAWPTRTLAAAEMAKGTIQMMLAQLRAISWPARASGPRVPASVR